MSRQDAQRSLAAQANQPMDPQTAGVRYPENAGEMYRALKAWEARRGLEPTGMRQSMWYASKAKRKHAPNPTP